MKDNDLPLPVRRCLSKQEAASYLGIGVTLMSELHIPAVRLGRRLVYDKLDLDAWLEEYKQRERGRDRKEIDLCPKLEKGSIADPIHAIGGLVQRSQTAKDYAKVLGLKPVKKRKPT